MSELRVLSYNVLSLRADFGALTRVVRAVGPDVLVAQEAPRRVRWRAKCAAFARESGLLYTAGGRTAGGNLLLVAPRVAVDEVAERRIPQPLGDPMRGIVGARLRIGADTFAVVGCHLGLRAARRAAEVPKVVALGEELGRGAPTIVAGDLNEEPTGPSWRAFAEAGYADVRGEDEPTFPADRPTKRIDAVLPSAGLEVLEYGVPESAAIRRDLRRASDHLPVLARLRLPNPPAAG
ncbi:MAG TPA: endonuclease/exonuclease/phosphatase family protein [Actinopolymorphaceae bacterium]